MGCRDRDIRTLEPALVAILVAAVAPAFGQGKDPVAKDIASHRAMAAAHAEAARCLEAKTDAKACLDALQKACTGVGIGKHCGLRSTSYSEPGRHLADHRTMAGVHAAAATCLESGNAEKACHEQLAKDCAGVGIGKYCGMRHAH